MDHTETAADLPPDLNDYEMALAVYFSRWFKEHVAPAVQRSIDDGTFTGEVTADFHLPLPPAP